MLTTSNTTKNTVVPYWDEIKKLSREDRNNLIELLEISLQEEESNSSEMETFIKALDENALKAAAEFAYKESRAGHCTPNSQILDEIKEEMGWM